MNGLQQIEVNNEIRALSDAEIAGVSGAATCTPTKMIFDTAWLQMAWVDCGGTTGIAINSGGDVTIILPR